MISLEDSSWCGATSDVDFVVGNGDTSEENKRLAGITASPGHEKNSLKRNDLGKEHASSKASSQVETSQLKILASPSFDDIEKSI